eukprot:Tbor_TRINITY_DN5431_c1_g3::TRINITY_DN5431_c1_g3_i1::g.24774::m.24774
MYIYAYTQHIHNVRNYLYRIKGRTMKRTTIVFTATPSTYKYFDPAFKGKNSKKGYLRLKAGDNVAQYDKGPVEWIPRPVRLTYANLDDLRNWMMQETVQGKTDEFTKIRELHREWSQHPMRPVLGDVDPRLPKNLFKASHIARRRFLMRWHKANHPLHWGWLPKPSQGVETPLHRTLAAQFPENWRAMRVSGSSYGQINK